MSDINAIDVLKADHREIEELFREFVRQRQVCGKVTISQRICRALFNHAQIEEEVAYPSFRKAGIAPDLLDKLETQHACMGHLASELELMRAGELRYNALVIVLWEQFQRHVQEEQTLFEKVQMSKTELIELGACLLRMKSQLLVRWQSASTSVTGRSRVLSGTRLDTTVS